MGGGPAFLPCGRAPWGSGLEPEPQGGTLPSVRAQEFVRNRIPTMAFLLASDEELGAIASVQEARQWSGIPDPAWDAIEEQTGRICRDC